MSIVLVDAYSQIFRMFYAVPMLNNPKGEPVNALMGVERLLLSLEKGLPSEFGAFAFDRGKATRRCALCPEYKAQRPPMPDALRSQIPHIMETIEAFGWPILMQEGLEADDLIAAVSRHREEHDVNIITGDKDIAQLTEDPHVHLATCDKGDAWSLGGPEVVQAKFGVPPSLLGDYLALVGDTSDNIIGVAGVGPKTAAKLLTECGSLDDILADIRGKVSNAKLAAKLEDSRELIMRNRKLVALDNVLPEAWNGLETIHRKAPDWNRLVALAEENAFNKLLPVLKKHRDEAAQPMLF